MSNCSAGLHQVEAVKQVGHGDLGQIDAYREPAQLSLQQRAREHHIIGVHGIIETRRKPA